MTLSRHFLLFLTTAVFAGCSGPDQLTVHQVGESLEVDGNLSNWDTEKALLKSTPEVDYYAANYGNHLYLYVEVKGPMKNNAIRQSGLIVYLSNSEENRKSAGLGFPAGTYNLLREYPGAFEQFTTEMDWGQKPENRELLTALSEEAYSKIMVIERPTNSNNPEYGFIDKSQLEIDGFEIATNEDSRYSIIEMKIPLGESSLFNLNKEKIWLGFSVEPPEFNFREENTSMSQRDTYGRRNQRQASMRYAITRNLGKSDDWFVINLE